MEFAFVLLAVFVTFVLLLEVFLLSKKFGRKDVFYYTAAPLILFSAGFLLRLSGEKKLIDAGFFMTGASQTLLSALFTLALILGQFKYWKR